MRIVVDDVSKAYGGLAALKNLSLTVEAGAITAIIGPNGAGKTTLFNAITGFDRIDEGAILLGERRIDRLSPWRIARLGIGRTFQTPAGFGTMSVWENLLTAGASDESERVLAAFGVRRPSKGFDDVAARAAELLERLELAHLASIPVEELSAGDAKLLEFARQLMRKPETLLLDEPAAGVAPDRIAELSTLLREFNEEGITIAVIDHNLSFVLDTASRVWVLASGEVLAEGKPHEVAKDKRVLETYLGQVA
ncbi:MAG: branched-chain amino acid transport system ATP-binding protein [Thermoleophilaceae bacterium]|jgi:ABC-type branched-subunit amino acid transport system ATPase component|nr:branched-chain amino acid transport system ATP-binding protein [Thermoleophilaceae bacterium]MEA2400708.1 branched-chain amino acid transport system ATP-binding protein [Thermoleophilaceae bacterium]